ncbi:B3 domain-containing protein At2g33720-like [Mangifera indica]|uniref:B3 domain-containing protein At2g33720-like n=1 Tax=Mangifera indica TaxID=29780 RepID=UPI001CFB7F6D|nr:B3 domain-containing protein At2g33720-like [Mangifera indica]
METQKQTPNKQKQISYRKRVIFMKRKSHNNPQDYKGTTEIPTKFNLVRQIEIKRQRTSIVSTELRPFDDTWPTAKQYSEGVEKERETANWKIARMKYCSPEEEEEERRKGVSTKLSLYTDPWKIKKKLTQSDLSDLCSLLLQASLVESHVLAFLNADEANKVQGKEGLRVMVLDRDTESEHSLVMKKWSTCKSYVFIEGWGQKFVNRRKLNPGDEIGFYWDPYTSMLNFSVIERDGS